MAVSVPHIMDVMIGVCAGSPPHIALCVCSVQERIGTYSGTYRNGNEMATFGQEWESKRNWTSPSEAVGPYPISLILWKSHTECIGTYTERVRISCKS